MSDLNMDRDAYRDSYQTEGRVTALDAEARIVRLSECANMLRVIAGAWLAAHPGDDYRCMVDGKPVRVRV